MPSLEMNKLLWTRYDWQQAGEEWSVNWGTTANLWHGTLMPRIGAFLGDVRAVEIGPGHGRLTAYLKNCCSSLVLVDIAPNCIEFCRERFRDDAHLEYFVNDGGSLRFLEDGSVDFVFSFDSLVHADLRVITDYIAEIERVLRIGGRAVLHHSNLASLIDQKPASGLLDNRHLRSRDVGADLALAAAAKLDTLECCTQELISWDDSSRLIDCISTFVRNKGSTGNPTRRFSTPEFYQRAVELRIISECYLSNSQPGG